MPNIGEVIEVEVVKILKQGAILTANDNYDYFLPISQAAEGRVRSMEDVVKVGEKIKARVFRAKRHKGKISYQLSLALLDEKVYQKDRFDKKLKDFLKTSDEIQKQLRQNQERKQNGRKNRRNSR